MKKTVFDGEQLFSFNREELSYLIDGLRETLECLDEWEFGIRTVLKKEEFVKFLDDVANLRS